MSQTILQILLSKYESVTLTKKQLAKELSVSMSTIDNFMAKGGILPKPIKIGTGINSSIRFNIIDVAEYITNNGEKQC